ncbi:LysR family transcriptional regulator [Pseudonocardia acaciae]|uniref:LysR family transcriptional regulator n=1 Tax=Pseudonocardia acaciae TaxID=551276 RepID=UPI000569CEE4|nr:LysR family transcriptional regulator [Pseudonocardia acaciae]
MSAVPSLDLLRSFLAVYRTGSITSAALLLGVAQPTVTAHIHSLENHLGRQLFNRHARGAAPTTVADELAERVARPLDALESVLPVADRFPSVVRLGGPAEMLGELAIPALADLVAGGMRLEVTFGLPTELLDAVAVGRIDLAICTVRPRRRGVVAQPLCDEEFVLVASPSWASRVMEANRATPGADPDVIGPRSLRDVPLLAYGAEAPILRRYWRTVFQTRLTRTPDVVAADLRALLTAVRAGAGATVLPRYLVAAGLRDGSLRAVASPELPPLNTLYLTCRPAVAEHRAITTVRDTLLAAARTW